MSSSNPRIGRLLTAAALCTSLALCTSVLAQPSNDTCATATLVNTFPFTDAQSVAASTATNTTAPQPSCDSGSNTSARFDIWYLVQPSVTGVLTINQGVDSIDSATQVWTNSTNDCNGTFTAVTCSDPETPSVSVTAGNTYFVQISYWFSTGTPTGNWNTSFSLSIPPANDACGSATPLTLGTPFMGDSSAASADGPTNTSTTNGCSSTFFATGNRTVWHTFTTTTAGVYTVSTCTNTGFDNKLAIYEGTACSGSVASLACNDDSCGTRSSVAANLLAGTTYTVRLSGTGTGSTGGVYTILVTGPQGGTAPVNDDGSMPTALAANTPTAGTLVGATGSSTTLATCGSSSTTGNDVWYTYTPTFAGTHTVAICGQYDTILSTHSSPTAASSVCNDDTIPTGCTLHGSQLTFTGVVGTPQLIRVAAVGPGTLLPEFGDFTITVTPPAVGACCLAGGCTVTASSSCTGDSVFQGNGTSCSPSPCPPATPGDSCAAPLTAVVGANPGTNLGASTDVGSTLPSGCASNNGTKDVYFLFNVPSSTTYTFSLCGSTTVDTIMSLYNAGACPAVAANAIACADDGCTTGSSLVSYIPNLALTAGQDVLIRIANFSSTAAGAPFVLTISSEPFGTCCDPATGGCTLVFQSACSTNFVGGATCTPNTCPQPPQACCAPDGSCTFVPSASCLTPNVAQGAGTTCTPNICPVPPSNDLCANASVASLGANAGNAAASTNDGRSSCDISAGRDVWWLFNPTVTGTYRIETCGGTPDWDTVVSVHTACAPDSSTQITGACGDQGCGTGNLSRISSIALTAGTNYLIRVAGWSTSVTPTTYTLTIAQIVNGACCTGASCSVVEPANCSAGYQGDNTTCTPNPCGGACCITTTGACSLQVDAAACITAGGDFQGLGTVCTPSPCPAPANDLCRDAQALTVGVASTGQNGSATTALDGPAATCQSSSSKSVWFTVTPDATASYRISTCGTNQDTVLQVYTIDDCDNTATWTAVACDDDTCDGVTPPGSGLASDIAAVTLNAGTTYYVRLSSFGSSATGGAYTILVSLNGTIGSCCIGTVCSLTDSANCTGTFMGGGACSPNPCLPPTGRCCVGARCAIVLPGDCTPAGTAGASFTAGASDCNAAGTLNTPCCFADYNKSGSITVQDIFDFLADYFTTSVNANVGGDGVAAPTVQDIFDFLSAYFAGGC